MMQSPIARTALRSLAGGLAAGTLVAAVFGGFVAQGQSIGGFNSDAPLNFAADRIELQDRQDRVVLSGNVDIAQGDLRLRAARTTVAYSDTGKLEIHRIDATGGVTVTRGGETVRGNVAIYDIKARIITVAGGVQMSRGTDRLSGGRLVIDLDRGVASINGGAGGAGSALGNSGSQGGRVTGSFSVPKRN
ncbi:LptA/OstA family protein [Novosphingobium sp. TH158]|uniref:LptA/OstA family protein n=1 Tax=Novosphingobium sp. TH158 TaxID=2067455 RepID=UPI0020B1228D|nr:LptA/OstA family protein [Novosphingobium sp. TH158]